MPRLRGRNTERVLSVSGSRLMERAEVRAIMQRNKIGRSRTAGHERPPEAPQQHRGCAARYDPTILALVPVARQWPDAVAAWRADHMMAI